MPRQRLNLGLRARRTKKPLRKRRELLLPQKDIYNVECKEINVTERNSIKSKTVQRLNELEPRQIKSMILKPLSDDTLTKVATMVIDGSYTVGSTVGTINDCRLGPIDKGRRCPTCKKDYSECRSHVGIIQLPTYMYKSSIHGDIIAYILDIVCQFCGKIKLSLDTIQLQKLADKSPKNRLKELANLSREQTCFTDFVENKGEESKDEIISNCKLNSNYVFEKFKQTDGSSAKGTNKTGELKIVNRYTGDSIPANLHEIYKILNSISLEDAQILGFKNGSSPVSLLNKYLYFLPPAFRSKRYYNGDENEDPLTTDYKEIVSKVNDYNRGGKSSKKTIIIDLIKKRHAMLYGSDSTKFAKISKGKKSLKEILSTKYGFIQQNVVGKRVNYSARAPIIPAPHLKANEISIPRLFSIEHSYPYYVTKDNLKEMQLYVNYGRVKNYIPFNDNKGRRTFNIDPNFAPKLYPGDIINMKLKVGDKVLINRQPSIHRTSMWSVIIGEINNGNAIKYSTQIVGPPNADFDGDEMNVHSPQTLEAKMELSGNIYVKNNVLSEEINKPHLGVHYDPILAMYLLTREDQYINKNIFIYCIRQIASRYYNLELTNNINEDSDIILNSEWFLDLKERAIKYNIWDNEAENEIQYNNKLLVSVAFPDYLNFTKKEKSKEFKFVNGEKIVTDIVNSIEIREGILLKGILTKDIIGKSNNNVVHVIEKYFKQGDSLDMITKISWIGIAYLEHKGFTISINDFIIPDIEDSITELFDELEIKVDEINTQKTLTKVDETKKEDDILNLIKNTDTKIQNLVDEKINKKDNNFYIMVKSGTKGKDIHISHMSAAIGQQYINGERIKNELGDRSMIYFPFNSKDIESKGYIKRNYFNGINPVDLFVTNKAGRLSLTLVQLSTQDSGVIQKDLERAQEELITCEDTSVRAEHKIFQLQYGNTGFNPMFLQKDNIDNKKFLNIINVSNLETLINSKYMIKKILKDRNN